MITQKALVLLSGGLDSMLAVCLVREQGVEVEALNVQFPFRCCKIDARRIAYQLRVRLTSLRVDDDYFQMLAAPKFGYGRGMNPCVDCRIYMFGMAKRYMEACGASFLVTGEVVWQRPMSQKLHDLLVIDRETGLEGLVVRPLSAKLLPRTEPEKKGILDRSKFLAVHGRSRQRLLDLAKTFGIEDPPSASSGCALTSPFFAKKVKDLIAHAPGPARWEFEALSSGRHYRLAPDTKVVLGRDASENSRLEGFQSQGGVLLFPEQFPGPYALLIGPPTADHLEKTGQLILAHTKKGYPSPAPLRVRGLTGIETLEVRGPAAGDILRRQWRIL